MKVRLVMLTAVFALVGCGGAPISIPTPAPAQPTPDAAQPTPDTGAPTPDTGAPTAQPGGAVCELVTAAEMSAIFGEAMSVTGSEGGACTWSAASMLPSIVYRVDSGEDIASAKAASEMLGYEGSDTQVAGNPAFYAKLMGAILYVEKGGHTLVVQAPLMEDDPIQAQVTQVAEAILARWP